MIYFNVLFSKKEDLRIVTMEGASRARSSGHNSRKVSWQLGIRWIRMLKQGCREDGFLKWTHVLTAMVDIVIMATSREKLLMLIVAQGCR